MQTKITQEERGGRGKLAHTPKKTNPITGRLTNNQIVIAHGQSAGTKSKSRTSKTVLKVLAHYAKNNIIDYVR